MVEETVLAASVVPVAFVKVRPWREEMPLVTWKAVPVPPTVTKVEETLVEETFEAETLPVASMFVEETLVLETVAAPTLPEASRLVEETLVEETVVAVRVVIVPEGVRSSELEAIPETVRLPVMVVVATVATPAPVIRVTPPVWSEVVAFTISAERVPVAIKVETVREAPVMLPRLSTLNLVEEFTCRSMKLPVKEAGFIPRKVPEAAPPWIVVGPNWTKEVVPVAWGLPERKRAWVPEAVVERRPPMVA